MENCVRKVLHREITMDDYKNRLRSVTEFERQLRDGGYLVLKLFLDISESEQHDRIFALRENFSTDSFSMGCSLRIGSLSSRKFPLTLEFPV